MIPKTKQRRLGWYFENVWMPEQREKIGKAVNAAMATVKGFIKFAECDPKLSEIDDETLLDFERYCQAQGYSARVSRQRYERIAEIVAHAIPPDKLNPLPKSCADGIRQYAKCELIKIKPELTPATVKNYCFVANSFCRWYGKDIAMADVTPELIEQFECADGDTSGRNPVTIKSIGKRLRQLMRTYDPVNFRIKRIRQTRKFGGGDSEFLLICPGST